MKQSKRILSLIIVACMLFSVVPAVAATVTTDTYGASIGTGITAVADRHNLVFGGDTAQWLILDADETTTGDAGVALISKDIVADDVVFNAGGLDNTWANSDAKTWLENYAASFDASALSYIMETSKAASAAASFGHNWSKDALSAEKFFFLSAEEVDQYFYNGSINGLIVADGWWLRSAYADRDILAGVVSDSGFVGYAHTAAAWGARPAFNVSADVVAVSSAAVGGKVSGDVGADALVAVGQASSDSWKLTLIDDAHSAFEATIGDGSGTITHTKDSTSWQLPITYSGAVAGENEYVSVLICNQVGEAVYYGHIASDSASGTVNVNIPAELSGKYTVYAYAEQCNGDNATDYGSALVSAQLNIDDSISSVETWNLTLSGDIQANFVLNIADSAAQNADSYVSVKVNGVEEQHLIADLQKNDDGHYMLSANVAAAQMTDNISIQIVTPDIQGSEYIYSVRSYGDYILTQDEFDEKTKSLVKAMLAYGGKAQDYFAYKTNDLADNGISVESTSIPYTEGLAPVITGSSDNVKYYGASLAHRNQTAVRFYFLSNDTAINNVTFTVELEDGTVYEGLSAAKSGSLYYIEVGNIAPDKLSDEIKVSADGVQVTYSPFYYIHRMYYNEANSRAMRDMMLAMYNYHLYAVAYSAV